jgi:hypothetical protein
MKILVALVSYDGRMECGSCLSLTQNVRYLDIRGFSVDVHYEVRHCYIPVARNIVVQRFMESDATDLIFMDADLVFDVSAMHQLLQYAVDVIGVVYPYKIDGEAYPVNIVNESNGTPHVENGLIEAISIPTGLMRIRRPVFERIIAARPELKMSNGQYSIFDTGNLWNDGTWYGEDVAFCRRFREIGGRIWILPDIDIAHVGPTEHIGNFHRYMMRQPQPKGAGNDRS